MLFMLFQDLSLVLTPFRFAFLFYKQTTTVLQ